MTRALKIAVIAGEESGDMLGADLIVALKNQHGEMPELVGVGGRHLAQMGLESLFAMEDISLVGLANVLKKLPRLIHHIHHATARIVSARPDCLIVIDSPDFTHRVARKVKTKLPALPIIQYVAPSVWAWRPERARRMCSFIDHLLVVLPFEVAELAKLGGPDATYVGHRLLSDKMINRVRVTQMLRREQAGTPPLLLLLPGSRHTEIRTLMPVFGETVALLQNHFSHLRLVLPTLPQLYDEVRTLAQNWRQSPEIIISMAEKEQAFSRADAALAASGTVSLELALSHIPMVLCYKADWFARHFILPRVNVWSAALPNIIADMPIVPEYYNEFVKPPMLARQLQRHMVDGAARSAQLEGFTSLLKRMEANHATSASGEQAASVVLDMISRNL